MIDFSKITEQKISEKYNSLSQDLKNVLSSTNTSVIIENTAAKYRLDGEKTEMLIQLVGLVILGFADLEDMKKEMKEAIDIDPSFIPLITDEMYQKIFSPIANSLKKTITTPTTAPRPAVPPAVSRVESLISSADHYREPATPEVVDLRKAPPVPVPKLPSVEAKPPVPIPVKSISPPAPIIPKPPVQRLATPLIEAEPHKVPAPISVPVPEPLSRMPQIILRSPGLPPTGSPRDILDLRKDKGEF